MKENQKIISYPSKNVKTESYTYEDTFVTKHFYDTKNAYVKEYITLQDGVTKIIHINHEGVHTKEDHFVNDKRHGIETKYMVSKNNKTVKSTKTYSEGKLHGECLTYNATGEVIKQEMYEHGKLVSKNNEPV